MAVIVCLRVDGQFLPKILEAKEHFLSPITNALVTSRFDHSNTLYVGLPLQTAPRFTQRRLSSVFPQPVKYS